MGAGRLKNVQRVADPGRQGSKSLHGSPLRHRFDVPDASTGCEPAGGL